MDQYSPNAGISHEEVGRAVGQSSNAPTYYTGTRNGITYPSPESTQPPRTHYTDIYRSYSQDFRPFLYPPPTTTGSSPTNPNMYQSPTSIQYPQQPPSTQYPSQMLNQYPSPISNQYNSPLSNQYTSPSIQYQSPPPTQYPQLHSKQYSTPPSSQNPPMGSQSEFPTTYGEFERDPTWNLAGWTQYQQQRQQFQMASSPFLTSKVEPVPPPKLPEANNHPNMAEPSPPLPIVETDLETTPVEEQEVKKPVKKPVILVGKRRGGKVLPTGNLGVSKKPRLENEKGRSDAWSRYMAEVKLYKDRSCEEDRKNRPLVK